ncbi:Fatty acid amide hydrolase 1 [Orchesella cincta]|uniref:Fatty acid amide hydrolase 1 n=1 Tax=Orchesella cincta TaxID=48709 RepID=A0A1D2MKV2_ORCCI|nr:Fatty acid amide hydrolase 1 [Orchesella cincta]
MLGLYILYEILWPWLYLFLTSMVCGWIYHGIFWIVGYLKLRSVIKRKQKEREEGFRKLEQQSRFQLNEEHEKILNLSDEELIKQLQTRRLKATEVLEAFIAKALKVTRKLNSITEFIPQAEEWARELDELKEVRGPFHGLPISVKDNCWVKGMDSSIGLAKYLYQPVAKDSAIVQCYKDLGAVPFCKTNVPQTLLSFGCQNPVFGVTKNNLNPDLTPGGSSGGESSLIGAGGSRLGLGSDIGGSVRIPAHFCGVAGFKGTSQRISGVGFRGSLPNVIGLLGVPGIFAQNAKMLAKASKHMLEDGKQNKYDPVALPLPWNEQMFSSKRKLRIGYFTSLPYFPLLGDCEEVTLNAKKALESLGHELVPFEMPDSFKMMDMVFDFGFADKGMHMVENWKNEPIPPALLVNFLICKAPAWFRRILVWIMNARPHTQFLYSQITRRVEDIRAGTEKSGYMWRRMGDRKAMIEEIKRSVLRNLGVGFYLHLHSHFQQFQPLKHAWILFT